VGRIDSLTAQLVHLVEHVEEIALGIDARALDARHHLADHLLARRGAGPLPQGLEVRQQVAIDEGDEAAERAGLERLPPDPVRRRPVLPAIGRREGRRKLRAHCLGLIALTRLPLIQNAEEEDPRELRHVLKRSGAV
jgi:hypothetical protein